MKSPAISTSAKLAFGLTILLAGAFYYLFSNLHERVEQQYFEAVEEPMVDAAHLFASLAEQGLSADGQISVDTLRGTFSRARDRQIRAQIYGHLKTAVTMNVYITDAQGIVLYDSDGGRAEGQDYSSYNDFIRTMDGKYGARSSRSDESDAGSSVMFVGAPILHGEKIIGVATVSKPQAATHTFRKQTKNRMNWLFRMVLGACLLGVIFIVGWFLRPIRRLTQYARAVRRGERVQTPNFGRGEVRQLGNAFEEMRETLEGRKYIETYVQTLTHEMKSPVAAIRGAAEILEDDSDMPQPQREKFLTNIQTETERLQNIIDRLLSLSAIEAQKNLESPRPVDLSKLVHHVCDDHHQAAESKNLKIDLRIEDRPVVEGEEFLLEMAVANLLQNAIDFSPKGSTLTVTLQCADRRAAIHIDDEGTGVPDYARERVFDRFYSLQHPDTGRKSSGLGLCFVREAAQLHNGSAKLEDRDPTGTRATLRLPCELATIK
jgi:two-component system sensor histidine kinase CreC